MLSCFAPVNDVLSSKSVSSHNAYAYKEKSCFNLGMRRNEMPVC